MLGPLGGLSTQPSPTDAGGGNDTGALFNWHPLLMAAALASWTEAALQFTSPAAGVLASRDAPPPRAARKAAHAVLHTVASVAAVGGVVAAWRSHTLKLPVPIPNLYSPHALAGAAALTAALVQAGLGAAAFVWPGARAPHPRAAFGRAHAAAGRGVLVATVAAALAGFAEKTAFVQVGKKLGRGRVAVGHDCPARGGRAVCRGWRRGRGGHSRRFLGPAEGAQQVATEEEGC